MDKDRRMYSSYLLRLWQTKSENDWVWRASLEHPENGEHHGFANLQDLFTFLKETIMGSNFEWQKHQVNERIESALGEAQSHRMTNQNLKKRGGSRFSLVKWLSAAGRALIPAKHKVEIPDTPHGEHLIDY